MQIDDFTAERRAPVSPPLQVIWPGSVQGRQLRSAFLGLRANEYAGNRVVSTVFLFIPEKQKRKKKKTCCVLLIFQKVTQLVNF